MALSQSSLSSRIQTDIEAEFGTVPNDAAQLQKFANAIAKAVIDEIQASAVVTSTGVVTSGVGAGGTLTATGTVS